MNAIKEIFGRQVSHQAKRITSVAILTLMVLVAGSVAQSSSRDEPTKLTTNEVKGLWSANDRNIEHYYSFVAGPGEIKVLLDYASDGDVFCSVYAQLSDADGRILTDLETGGNNSSIFGGLAHKTSERKVARYQIKRRQTIIIKIWIDWSGGIRINGHYKIRLEGDVSLNQAGGNENNSAGKTRPDCLPKSGILQFIMSDGTTQEINLSRLREVSVKP